MTSSSLWVRTEMSETRGFRVGGERDVFFAVRSRFLFGRGGRGSWFVARVTGDEAKEWKASRSWIDGICRKCALGLASVCFYLAMV